MDDVMEISAVREAKSKSLLDSVLAAVYAANPDFKARVETEEQTEKLFRRVKTLDLFKAANPDGEENEVLKPLFLNRGGIGLFIGPSGAGKSSFLMQAIVLWALGRPVFEIRPARPLTTILVQAENDDFDIARMRDGVFEGLNLSPEERRAACSRILVLGESSKTKADLITLADALLGKFQPDLIILDPLLAYIGGDINKQEVVSLFVRNMLLPILQKNKAACILVHHTNKPSKGKEKDGWAAGDFAYLGAGSADLTNAARCILALRSIGEEERFELRAAKRGGLLGWKNAAGEPTRFRFVAHSRGRICWTEAEAPAGRVPGESRGKPREVDQKIVNIWADAKEEVTFEMFADRAKATHGVIRQTTYSWWQKGKTRNLFKISAEGKASLTGKVLPEAVSDAGCPA